MKKTTDNGFVVVGREGGAEGQGVGIALDPATRIDAGAKVARRLLRPNRRRGYLCNRSMRANSRRLTMLGRLLIGAIAAGMAWKYRDSLREYMKRNVGPAREQIDRLARTVQDKSRGLFDPASGSSRIERTREKVPAGVSEEGRSAE